MVYSPTGSSDLFLNLGCMTLNFLYLSLSTFYSSSLWETDTTVFPKLNTPHVSIKPPVSGEGGGRRYWDFIEDFR